MPTHCQMTILKILEIVTYIEKLDVQCIAAKMKHTTFSIALSTASVNLSSICDNYFKILFLMAEVK